MLERLLPNKQIDDNRKEKNSFKRRSSMEIRPKFCSEGHLYAPFTGLGHSMGTQEQTTVLHLCTTSWGVTGAAKISKEYSSQCSPELYT
ncbi:unnamed protein product [Caretta caretta]